MAFSKTSTFIVLGILVLLFLFSVFKNISYPLFWEDESLTVVGGERTLTYGYPKVHDGKNVLYDIRHPNRRLGIDEKTDAFIGNANWAMYYLAAVGVKLAEYTDDIYLKTAIIRSLFAVLGIVGIFLFGINSMLFLKDFNQRMLFLLAYLIFTLLSVSLTLHIREARYYSIVLTCSAVIIFLFTAHHILNKIPYWVYSVFITINLVLLFLSFSLAYFIFYVDIALYLGIGYAYKFFTNLNSGMKLSKNIKTLSPEILKYACPYIVGFLAILPLLHFFKSFQIAGELKKFNGYGFDMYLSNLGTIWDYLSRYDHLYLTVILKIIILIFARRMSNDPENMPKFKMSFFLGIFTFVYILFVATIPNYIFSRYFTNLQPVMLCSALLDMFILYSVLQKKLSESTVMKTAALVAIGLLMGRSVLNNKEFISGHCYEITHRYKGCVDYVVEYIRKNVRHPEDLIISTNYEETSFMYYLKSKVIIGFVRNNLKDDLQYQPDIVIYRKGWKWQRDQKIFLSQLQKTEYIPIYLPITDYYVNNIPELSEDKLANRHQFKTLIPDSSDDQLVMFVRKDKAYMFPVPTYDGNGDFL